MLFVTPIPQFLAPEVRMTRKALGLAESRLGKHNAQYVLEVVAEARFEFRVVVGDITRLTSYLMNENYPSGVQRVLGNHGAVRHRLKVRGNNR
jgi:hypothetical protein